MPELRPELETLRFHGSGLNRPEGVIAHASGLLFAADWTGTGGVSIIDPATGSVTRHLAKGHPFALKPNGILLDDDASFLLTHLGTTIDDGGVFRLHPDGSVSAVLTQLHGAPLPPTNFAAKDRHGRIYVTVSTRHIPRHTAARPGIRDGFVALLTPEGDASIVADNLGYTNECIVSADGKTLFVNETFGRSTAAFDIAEDGTLGPYQAFASYGDGIFPDGMALDEEGGLWIVSIVSNTVLRGAPGGRRALILHNRNSDRVMEVERAFLGGRHDRSHLDAPHAGPLHNVSSLAFGGDDLRTVYLGCLLGDSIASFESSIAGLRPAHFDVDLTPLSAAGKLPVSP